MQLFTKILLAFAGLSVVSAVPLDAEKRDGNYRSVAYYVDWVSRWCTDYDLLLTVTRQSMLETSTFRTWLTWCHL
jgi:hypothetical protein